MVVLKKRNDSTYDRRFKKEKVWTKENENRERF